MQPCLMGRKGSFEWNLFDEYEQHFINEGRTELDEGHIRMKSDVLFYIKIVPFLY